jgi:hypothetical protein
MSLRIAYCHGQAAGSAQQSTAHCGLSTNVALVATSSAQGLQVRLADDGLLCFLAILVLLLALALIAVIRLSPDDARPSDVPAQVDPGRQAAPALPVPIAPPAPRQRVSETSAPTLSARPPGQSGHRVYAARHGPGPVLGQDTTRRPKVSGSPPWGPAPRPPGIP